MGKSFNKQEAQQRLNGVPGWNLHEGGGMIWREHKAKNFVDAVELINRITTIAEELDHHPDIHLTGYRNLRIELSTHSAGGLTDKDFTEAARINELT